MTENDQVSGTEVITAYIKGDHNAEKAYTKICAVLERLDHWPEGARAGFLEQLLDVGYLLDENCKLLVQRLCNVSWLTIPASQLPRFQRMLCEIALRHISHTESIYEACIVYFRPIVTPSSEPSVSSEQQESFFNLAHSIIAQVLRCVPMSSKVLLKTLRSKFPHHATASDVYTSYLRNFILVGEYATHLRPSIWENVIFQLINMDRLISRTCDEVEEISNSSSGIFVMDEEETRAHVWSGHSGERVQKMDICMRTVFDYIAVKMGRNVNGAEWLRVGEPCDPFDLLCESLDLHLLMGIDIHFVPFIWLYMCNLNPNYPNRLFEWLWARVTHPQRGQSDAKKSHGAAAYLAAFLARAMFVDIDESFEWMRKICDWLLAYLDSQAGASATALVPGASRHGTFYSLCQTFFIVFCFRYKRIVAQPDKWEQVRRWGLARVVHSSLDPLKFVSRPVALCFATISRSLQLVYCNHYLPALEEETPRPFEVMFPLDSYRLPETSSLVKDLMRKFAPLAEDVALLSKELKPEQKPNDQVEPETAASEAMAFLDEEEEMEVGSFRERSDTVCGAQSSNMFTSFYATSPGLKHFDAGLAPPTNGVSMDIR